MQPTCSVIEDETTPCSSGAVILPELTTPLRIEASCAVAAAVSALAFGLLMPAVTVDTDTMSEVTDIPLADEGEMAGQEETASLLTKKGSCGG